MGIPDAELEVLLSLAHSKIDNYVWPGLSSRLLGGGSFGKVRLFENTRYQYTDIVPHSHRYDFLAVVLKGTVMNRLWYESASADAELYELLTLTYDGQPGQHYVSNSGVQANYEYQTSVYKSGEMYSMTFDQIHSIEFSKDAIVLMFEGPAVSEVGQILQPVVNGVVVPTFKTQDWMFQKTEEDES